MGESSMQAPAHSLYVQWNVWTLSLAWGLSIWRWRNLLRVGREDCRSQKGWRTPAEHGWPTESTKQDSRGPKEIEATSMNLHGSVSGLSVYMLWLLACCYWRTPNSGSGDSSDSCLLLRFFSSCWVSLPSLNLKALVCFVISCFVLLGYRLLETCSLLKRK